MDWKLPREGACRCGQVRLRLTKAPIATAACHCRGCQKMSSSAFSLTVMAPEDGFEVTAGETVIGGMHAPELQHHFCPHCMSWLFTRPRGFGFVNVRSPMLEGAADFAPFMETFTEAKMPFAETGAARSFEQFPPHEAFGELLAEFAAWTKARSA